jgi:hypothetical protein
MSLDIQAALANEARRRELQIQIATTKGELNATSTLQRRISAVNADASIMLSDLQSQLDALNAGAGAGITANFGEKTELTQLLEVERKAGAKAVIALIKTNEKSTEEEAIEAWEAAAAKATGMELCAQRGRVISLTYRQRLAKEGAIASVEWSDFAAWISTTNIDEIKASI